MTGLFADTSKFCKVTNDNTITQLSTLENYLRTIYNRGEITVDEYNTVRPQLTKPARAHGHPKTHKPFDNLPPLRPIIETTGAVYQPLAKYLSQLLNPQIDGVSMGSPLSPTLANIIMTALEDEIVRDLIDQNVIKFYIRYVDDTLVLIKLSDINFVLNKLNSYHSQI